MPDAFISMTTSWASGVGSGKGISYSPRSPVNTTPRMVSSVCYCLWPDLGRKNVIGKGRTDSNLARLIRGSSVSGSATAAIAYDGICEKRVALVLGNSAYQNAPQLANPVNDGAVVAATLKAAGFDVVDSRHDLPAAETRRALRDFSDRARDADIAVVYYAGHGMEVDGTNYLIPVDAKLERDTDVYDEALSLDRVLVAIEPATRLRLVILD